MFARAREEKLGCQDGGESGRGGARWNGVGGSARQRNEDDGAVAVRRSLPYPVEQDRGRHRGHNRHMRCLQGIERES